MKRWMKITALTVVVVNLMMLTVALSPVLFVSKSQVAFAGDDHPTLKAQDNSGDPPEALPDSCKKIKVCHGFWNCFKRVLRCVVDIID